MAVHDIDLANWFLGELTRLLKESGESLHTLRFTPAQFAALLALVDAGTLSANAGKEVLGEMFRTGRAPDQVVADKGLAQVSDTSAVEAVVDQVLARMTLADLLNPPGPPPPPGGRLAQITTIRPN
jgi:aspartyl-tRNA(Asn)/glutamyl-tRNA(Gln) amidotransferase subunit B